MTAPTFSLDDPDRQERVRAAIPAVDRLFVEHVSRHRIPGAAYGLILDGDLVHKSCMGVCDIAGRAPVTPGTLVRIASMTKTFTAMAILKLRDEGRLSLDDRVDRHVPEVAGWTYSTSDAPRLTLRHLLTMSGGLPQSVPSRRVSPSIDGAARWRGWPFAPIARIVSDSTSAQLERAQGVASSRCQIWVSYSARKRVE